MKTFFLLFILTGTLPLLAITGKICFTGQEDLKDQWMFFLPKRPRQIHIRKSVVRGEKIKLAVLVGKMAEKNGKVKISFSGKLISPSGNVSGWNNPAEERPQNKAGFPLLLWNSIDFRFEMKDPLGTYQVELMLQDENSGENCLLKTSIELTEKDIPQEEPQGKVIPNMAKMEFFYIRKDTALVIPALKELVTVTIPKLASTQKKKLNPLPALGFFYEVLKEETQLYPELVTMTTLLEGDAQKYVLFLISCLGPETAKMLPKELQKKIQTLKINPFELKAPAMPWQVELFWSRFFATGKRAPLLPVIGAVSMMKNGMTPETYRTIKEPTERDKASLAGYLTGRAALMTLKKNSLKHPHVYWYMEGLLAANSIRDPFTRVMIDQLVQELRRAEQKAAVQKKKSETENFSEGKTGAK